MIIYRTAVFKSLDPTVAQLAERRTVEANSAVILRSPVQIWFVGHDFFYLPLKIKIINICILNMFDTAYAVNGLLRRY